MKEDVVHNLVSLLTVGIGILVATRSEYMKPAITRGWGRRFDEVTDRLEISVTAAPESVTLSNLELARLIAVTATQPTTYRTMQMKSGVDYRDYPHSPPHFARYVTACRPGTTSPSDTRREA